MTASRFLLIVITTPEHWPGEEDCLEALLEAGLEKLHIRKPGNREGLEGLLRRLSPRWRTRLVLHGGRDVMGLAKFYGVPQVHGHWQRPWEGGEEKALGEGNPSGSLKESSGAVAPLGSKESLEGIALSASLHSFEELKEMPPGRLEYVFISPLFDSISKPGYLANGSLLRRPAGVAPCGLVGLGGIDRNTIGRVIEHGWDGAAVLGAIWERREVAVESFMELKEIIKDHGS